MEDTYIMYDDAFYEQAKTIQIGLGIKTVSYQFHEKEAETHEWITRTFKENKIKRLLIPLSLHTGDTDGLMIALHIRLNYELDMQQRSIPIIVLTNLSLENILYSCTFDTDSNPQNLLFTSGVSISSTDIEEIEEKIVSTPQLDSLEYDLFLKKLSINRKSYMGHHDIANAWGCYKLSQVVGHEMKSSKVKSYLGQLYAKWLICQNNLTTNGDSNGNEILKIDCKGKRILFIDDKSDEGWKEVLSVVFQDAKEGFVCVDSGKYKETGIFDYSSFIEECESHIGEYWDLIIIDLRLNPDVEDIDTSDIKPDKLSGYLLIDKFLEYNAGYQIMVLTASNKIWNVDAAIKRGAKGYFIKESPVFNQSYEESVIAYEKNFKLNVDRCFQNSYLFVIYEKIYEYGQKLPKNELGDEIYTQLDIAFELLCNAKTEDQFSYAYVTLYMIIETINNHLVNRNGWLLPNGNTMHRYEFDKDTQKYSDKGEFNSFSNPSRFKMITSLLLQEWKIPNGQKIARDFYSFIDKRDAFIHKDSDKLAKYPDLKTEKSFVKLFNTLGVIFPYLYTY